MVLVWYCSTHTIFPDKYFSKMSTTILSMCCIVHHATCMSINYVYRHILCVPSFILKLVLQLSQHKPRNLTENQCHYKSVLLRWLPIYIWSKSMWCHGTLSMPLYVCDYKPYTSLIVRPLTVENRGFYKLALRVQTFLAYRGY